MWGVWVQFHMFFFSSGLSSSVSDAFIGTVVVP